MNAAEWGRRDTVQCLCENGANINAANRVSDNRTVMYVYMYVHYIYVYMYIIYIVLILNVL